MHRQFATYKWLGENLPDTTNHQFSPSRFYVNICHVLTKVVWGGLPQITLTFHTYYVNIIFLSLQYGCAMIYLIKSETRYTWFNTKMSAIVLIQSIRSFRTLRSIGSIRLNKRNIFLSCFTWGRLLALRVNCMLLRLNIYLAELCVLKYYVAHTEQWETGLQSSWAAVNFVSTSLLFWPVWILA